MRKIKVMLEEEDKVRDSVIQQQRKIIRICSEAIKSVHRKEFDIADNKIAEARKMLKEIFKRTEKFQTKLEIEFTGLV